MSALFLGILLSSFILTSICVIPFIHLLYTLHFTRKDQKTRDFQDNRTPIFDKLHQKKSGTPVGGGVLIILVVSILYLLFLCVLNFSQLTIFTNFPLLTEVTIIFFVFVGFGLLGVYDDILKFFKFQRTGFFGLRMKGKLILQIVLALVTALLIYFKLKIDFIYFPFFGTLFLGPMIIILNTLIIVAFANSYNITDGLDGLSSGLLLICLFAFSFLSATSLDTPISLFLALWIGSILAFLYFNVYPARIMLGDAGALSFGATLAVIALLLGKIIPLLVIGAPFLVEMLSSLVQILSKKYRHKKILPVAPLHLYLQHLGWEEPKIVARAWLAGIFFAILGLWLALL